MSEWNKMERDALIEDILNQVSKEKKENRAVPETPVNRQGDVLSRANEIMDMLFPEEAGKRAPKKPLEEDTHPEKSEPSTPVKVAEEIKAPEITPIPSKDEKENTAEKKEKTKKDKKRRGKNEKKDVLSEITPWDERRKMHEGGEDSFDDMAGHKKVSEFYSDLKNRASVEQEKEEKPEDTEQREEIPEEIVVKQYDQRAEVINIKEEKEEVREEVKEEPVAFEEPIEVVKIYKGDSKPLVKEEDTFDDLSYEPTKYIPEIEEKDGAAEIISDAETIIMDSLPSEPQSEVQLKLPGFDKKPKDSIKGEFVKRRREVIEQFEVDPNALPQEEPVAVKNDEDYNGIEDAESMRLDFLLRSRQIKMCHVTTVVLALLSTVLTIFALPGVAVFNMDEYAEIYLALNLVAILIAIIVNFSAVFGSVSSLFTKSNSGGIAGASLGLLSGFVVNVLLFIFIGDFANSGLPLFNCLYLWAFSFALSGERANVNRVRENFELVANEKVKTSVTILSDSKYSEDLASGMTIGAPEVAITKKGVDLKSFLYHSLAQDDGDSASFIMSYALVPLALICGLLCYFFAGDNRGEVVYAINAFSGGLAILIPFAGIMGGGKAVSKICRILRKEKIMISGYDAAELCEDVNVITLDAADLFPQGTVKLVGVKTASTQAIDRSIQDIAAVMIADGGPLAPELRRIVEDKMSILPTVEAPVYEDGMGISGWVSGNRVLVGNKALMEHHEIYIPENNFEEEAQEKGLSAVYLSNEGRFAAVFFVKYSPARKIVEDLKNAVNKGMSINIYSNDPFISHDMICRLFSLPSKSVKLMDTTARKAYKNVLSEEKDLLSAMMMHTGHAGSTARVLTSAVKMKKVCEFVATIQYVLSGVGMILSCIAILQGGASGIGILAVAGYYLLTILFSQIIPTAVLK